MGLFLLSLESGFFVLCSCQIDQCLISILLWYLSLSESGGKDKTMMMNMMTGAVAINGGVGVMEVRQPQVMEKAVQDAGHIAADIAENAHITLHEFQFAEAVIGREHDKGSKNLNRDHFIENFIQKANELPEANRFLVDRLYETAWRTIFVFKYGCDPEDIPAPWYDKKGGTEE